MEEQKKYERFIQEVLEDYRLAYMSRQMSIIGRKEVLAGRAKFGILGDGKEVAQLALAKQFKAGDWRSGYYRDQTFMMATHMMKPEEFFAQLYGDTSLDSNPAHGGRSFNNHFATRSLDEHRKWKNLMQQGNSSADISPTAGQMPRLLGLAYASKIFRENKALHAYAALSNKGKEVAFGTIGDASTSEGHFFETINAAGVLQVPMALSVWDDGFGISVPRDLQTTKDSISKVLEGFRKEGDSNGIVIYRAKGWDYVALCKVYEEGIELCRSEQVPVVFHIEELTQPLGHSTSGSHERYKSEKQLHWEKENDCLVRMRSWMIEKGIATEEELQQIEQEEELRVKTMKKEAYRKAKEPVEQVRKELLSLLESRTCICPSDQEEVVKSEIQRLKTMQDVIRKDIHEVARRIDYKLCSSCHNPKGLSETLRAWLDKQREETTKIYSRCLYNESAGGAIHVKPEPIRYADQAPRVNGSEVLNANFDALFANNERLLIFGEDCGKLGDVNQGLVGLQEKYGKQRVIDTGIRETTILGQGIGLALRGLRPIAEIQYLDYLLYALQTMSDDLATTHWRTAGGQVAPLIIRTRGHRFEGVWHAGSPLGMILDSCRGMYVCVPRNMTQAAGFYNTLLEGEDPALVIEPLKAYRKKELMPENLGEFRLPLGVPEILIEGKDVTVVTYGSCVPVALEAAERLREYGIEMELIDVRTLLPFDVDHYIKKSLEKTGRIVFMDEDVPGGASAYMMYKVMEEQAGFYLLDSAPKLLSAKEHRPAYSTDGDYFSNPNSEDLFDAVYSMVYEAKPSRFE